MSLIVLYVFDLILVLILSVMDCYLRVNRVNRTDPSLTRLLWVGVFPWQQERDRTVLFYFVAVTEHWPYVCYIYFYVMFI